MPVVNIEGDQAGPDLKFTGSLLADIFLGKMKNLERSRRSPRSIRMIKLPNAAITVVHRSDGSGTTFNCVNYLFKGRALNGATGVGEGTAVEWPVGVGGKGNEGVAAFVQPDEEFHRLRRIRLCAAE